MQKASCKFRLRKRCRERSCPINNDYYINNFSSDKYQERVSECSSYEFEKQESHVNTYRDYKSRVVLKLSCREIGRGGISLYFHVTPNGLKGIWISEYCPVLIDGYVAEDGTEYERVFAYDKWDGEHFSGEASDGHNVSEISWSALKNLVEMAEKEGWI